MEFVQNKCPECGACAGGIVEEMQCIASLVFDEDEGEYDYDGSTKALWETQTTTTNHDGTLSLVCAGCREEWDTEYAGVMPRNAPDPSLVSLCLSADDLGQIVEGLETRAESWERTAEYLESDSYSGDGVIEECSDSEEARTIGNRYRSILERIQEQTQSPT